VSAETHGLLLALQYGGRSPVVQAIEFPPPTHPCFMPISLSTTGNGVGCFLEGCRSMVSRARPDQTLPKRPS